LHDNEALTTALKAHPSVVPVFAFETDLIAQPDYSAMHVHAWYQALKDLRARLRAIGSDVYVQSGNIENVLATLLKKVRFNTIYSHEETGNDWTYQRDVTVARWCDTNEISWLEFPQTGVIRRLKNRANRQNVIKQLNVIISPYPITHIFSTTIVSNMCDSIDFKQSPKHRHVQI